ncbi:MAG: hypothetical protein JRN54_04750 [Nitrososphaerota archaeon]|jgi:hypothetical protein|nr:hypothetical protein [Nitrososphaerota archaeon]
MSIVTLEDKARKALDEQFRIKPPVGQAEEVKFLRISDAVPLTTMTANCPLCSAKWTPGHSLLFFMEKMHHDNIIEVLKFHIGLANRVEAMATRLATTGGENLFHEKDVVQLFKEMYEKGPAAVDFAFGIVGYYVSHQREYEGTKRSVKIELDEVLEHFSGVAEFYQAKAARFRELWGDRAQAKMEELYGEEAAADLRRVRSLVFRDEALMNGEMEKVQELLHEDPMQWIKALAAAGVQPVQSPALPSPPPAQKGGK